MNESHIRPQTTLLSTFIERFCVIARKESLYRVVKVIESTVSDFFFNGTTFNWCHVLRRLNACNCSLKKKSDLCWCLRTGEAATDLWMKNMNRIIQYKIAKDAFRYILNKEKEQQNHCLELFIHWWLRLGWEMWSELYCSL